MKEKLRFLFKMLLITASSIFIFFGLWYLLIEEPKGIYELPKAEVSYNVRKDGLVEVEERITYLMTKPYRGVHRFLSFPIYMSVEDPKIRVEGAKIERVEWLENTPVNLDFKVYFVESLRDRITPRKGGDSITLILRYKLRGAVEVGRDFSQFFPKPWGENWGKSLKSLKVTVNLPWDVKYSIYFHPRRFVQKYEKVDKSLYIVTKDIPARKGFEFRILFDEPLQGEYFHHVDKTKKDVLRIEKKYTMEGMILTPLSFLLLGIIALLPIMLYIRFGREPKVEYEREYEHEIPYNDHPAVVNVIVKREFGYPDSGAIGASMTRLHHAKAISFEDDGIRVLKKTEEVNEEELHSYDIDLLEKLHDLSEDGWIDTKNLKKKLKRSKKMAEDFYHKIKDWFDRVYGDTQRIRKDFLRIKGYILAKIFGILYMVSAILSYFCLISNNVTSYHPLADLGFKLVILFSSSIGFFMLFTPKVLFGSWTEYGKLYRLRWFAFQRYITDFSALSEHPPQSVEIWDEYMIYAIALGVAKNALKVFRKFVEKMNDAELMEKINTYETGLITIGNFSALYSTVASSMNVSSSSVDSEGWGGDVGSGFGGGGGDAF